MFGLMKKMIVILWTSIASAFNHTKFTSLSNQKCLIQPTFTNLHPNEYIQEWSYYQFQVNVDRCGGSCNTLDNLSSRVCVSNKTKDLNLHAFNLITGINQSRTLTKHILFKFECKCDSKKSAAVSVKIQKNMVCTKGYICNPSTYSCENSKYVGNIIDEPVFIWDEITSTTKAVPTRFISTEAALTKWTSTYFYILLAFLLITTTSLIAVGIYCYFIKCQAKQKLLFSSCYTIN